MIGCIMEYYTGNDIEDVLVKEEDLEVRNFSKCPCLK